MLRTEGIVLNEIRFKETSKILNIYTKKYGKINVMAKGAYNAKSKLMAHTQPFSHNEYRFHKGRSFHYINEASTIHSFYNIRENMERVIYGFYILELVNKSISEEEENEVIFLLLEKALTVLSNLDEGFLKFIIAFELKYISFLGYRPYMERCVSCGNKNFKLIRFSISKGGIICDSCFFSDLKAKTMDKAMYEGMVRLLYAPLDDLDDIIISEKDLKRIQDIMESYILFNIDRKEFNSLNILKTMMI